MAIKMWVPFIVYVTIFSWISADENPFTKQYIEGDRAMLKCSGEYNETIQLSSVLYNYSTCSHDDIYGIQNLCDGRKSCSFDVTNSNIGSSCGADGKASLQVLYKCKRNGGWSIWTRYSTCSVTCGGGTQLYTRSCTNPSPNLIGAFCVGESYYVEVCNDENCFNCSDQKFYDRHDPSLQLKTDSSVGTGYLLIDPVNAVHCCGQITLWHYVPVDSGTIKFSVWRKISVNSYKVVGTNTVVIKATDVNKQTTYNVPANERTLIKIGDIIGWHDGGQDIIGYYDCLPSKKPCPTTILRNSMGSTNVGDEINVESLPQQSNRNYTMSYTSAVKGPPTFGMTPDSVTIDYHISVNSRVMDIQITDYGFIQKVELDYDSEYFYFDTHLRSILVKKMLPQKRTRHTYVLSVQDWCYNTATLNVTIVARNTPPRIHGLQDTLRFNPININPNLITFTVDDPSDNVTCMINKTSPHTDMFILSLHDNNASLILSENSSIDVNTASEYVIKISCTDGTDTTSFDLTILFTTNKPDTPSTDNSKLIIIGSSIGGSLFVFMLILCVVFFCYKR